MKEEVAVDIFMGLGKEAVTQKCIPKQSKSVSISGRQCLREKLVVDTSSSVAWLLQ